MYTPGVLGEELTAHDEDELSRAHAAELFTEARWAEHGGPRCATLQRVAPACARSPCSNDHAKLPHVWRSCAAGSSLGVHTSPKPKQ